MEITMTKEEAFNCAKQLISSYWRQLNNNYANAMIFEVAHCKFKNKEDVEFIISHLKGMRTAIEYCKEILEEENDTNG